MAERGTSAFAYCDTLLCLDLVSTEKHWGSGRVADSVISNAKFKMSKQHLIIAVKQGTFSRMMGVVLKNKGQLHETPFSQVVTVWSELKKSVFF